MHDRPDFDPQVNPPHGDGAAHSRPRGSGSFAALPDALRSALVGYEVSMERLNEAVVAFVVEMRSKGMSAEQVVPEVRNYLAGLPRWAQPVDGVLPADMTVIDRAVQWAIEAYYETPDEESSVA